MSPLGLRNNKSPEGRLRRQTKDKEGTITLTSREQSFFLKCNYDPIIQISTSGILQSKPLSVQCQNGMLIRYHFFPVHGQIAWHLGKDMYREGAVLWVQLSDEKLQGYEALHQALFSPTHSPKQ